MQRVLLATCAVAVLGGVAFAQAPQSNQAQPNKATPQANNPAPGPSQSSTQPQAQQNPSTTSQSGIRTAQPVGAVQLQFYSVQPADMRASKLIGSDVYNRQNESIGEVQDLIIDNGKNVKGVVIGVGGFLGMGERNVAVDPGSLLLTEQNDGSARLVINTTKEDLKGAPAFNFADVDKPGAATTGTTANRTSTPTNNAAPPSNSPAR